MTILFDLDGTLIDSTEAILESFYRACDALGFVAPQEKEITALIGHPLDEMFRRFGISEPEVWEYVDTYKAHYREISREKTLLLDGALEAVEEAARFARLGIVTTKTGRYSRELMEHFGIMNRFEVLIGREDVEHPKPHAEPIEKALAAMKSDKASCWMIGDTRMDIEAARNAAIGCVAVSSGYESEEALLQWSETVVPDALEAVRLIAALSGGNK